MSAPTAPEVPETADEAQAREGAELLATLAAEDAAAAAQAAADAPLPMPVEQIPLPSPQQGEMPFAIVDGEPLTEPPKDLYIPPQALKVFLEAFEGPLDLLLYLIRRQNLDILDIPIAEITRQYLEYIDLMQTLELELAGEYLLMAAMLAEIKSRLLLPRPSTGEAEEDDPRAELVRRLQEYERYKKAAEDVDQLKRVDRDVYVASAEIVERKVAQVLPDVTLKEMLLAFKDVIQRAAMFAHHTVTRERLSVRQRMSEILERLHSGEFVGFTTLFTVEEGRMGVTVTFIAVLELVREGLLELVQADSDGVAPLHVRPAQGRAPSEAANDAAPTPAAAAGAVAVAAESEDL